MSLPWFKVYKDLPEHPKSDHLAALLGDERAWTYMVQLWCWVAKTRPDGDLSRLPDTMIASRAGWRGDAVTFVDSAVEAGFIDGPSGERTVHNWAFYQEKQAERRKKDKLAKQEKRAALRSVLPTVLPTVVRTVLPTVLPSVGSLEEKREEKSRGSDLSTDPDRSPNLVLFADAPSAAGKVKTLPKADPQVVIDREAWLTKARALTGLTPEESPPAKTFFTRFAIVRKARGIKQMLRALDGLEGDSWARQLGLVALLSDAVIEKGLSRAKAPARTGSLDLSKMDYSTWDEI